MDMNMMEDEMTKRERNRERHRRGDRPSRFQDRSPSNDRDRGRRVPPNCRVYISNIPYEFRWQDLKDLFRSEVGEVEYVELFGDDSDKPRGCGVVEFANPDSVKKAIEKLHRHEVRGRKLVVKEEFDMDRESSAAGRMMPGGGMGNVGGGNMMGRGGGRDERNSRWSPRPSSPNSKGWGFTYGLSIPFLEGLGIKGPLVNRVFIANLDYKVDENKLKEVFKLAGKVVSAELNKDKEGKSRGHGVVEYEHPVEAVQAISMLHHQMLYDRLLTVRMDRVNDKTEDKPLKLPEGLRGIGFGLGENGKPLQDVSRSLPANLQNAQMNSLGMAALQSTANIAGLANQAALGGMAGLGNMSNSVGMGGFNTPASGLSSVMSAGLSGNLAAAGLGGGLVGLGGPSGGLGGLMGASMNQGGGDIGLGNLVSSGMNSNNMGGSNLNSGSMGGGFGSSSLGITNMGSSNFNSGGMNQMPGSGSYMGGGGGGMGGNSGGFGMTGSTNSGGPSNYGSRSFDMGGSSGGGGNTNFGMEDRDFRGGFNNGQQMKMEPPSMDIKSNESDTIVVRNLPQTVTWQMLRDKFREFGDVKFAEIRNKDTGLVRFSSSRDAQRACNMMDGSRIDGRVVDVLLY